jgi:hypothetical protein
MTPETTKDPNPMDREERIRQRAHRIWEEAGRPEGKAQEHWERAAQELDREDAEVQRQRPGVKSATSPERDKT